MTGLVDVHGRPLRPAASLAPGGYEGASRNRQQTREWPTISLAAQNETEWGRQPVSARAQDLVRNNGKAEGARRSKVDRVIGKGLRFRSRPNARALDVDPREALAFGRLIERELFLWGAGPRPECDIGRELVWGQIQRVLFSDRKVDGDSLAVMRWRPDRGTRYGTCVQLVDAARLSNPHDMMDLNLQRQGVELSEDGAPVAYHIRNAHPNDMAALGRMMSWTRYPRFDDAGHPVVIHGFDARRSEQVRGMSMFAPVLLAFRDVGRFSEAELGAAILNAIYAGFIKSNFDPVAVAEAIGLEAFEGSATSQKSWQDIRMSMMPAEYTIGDNRIPVLPPGDEMASNNTTRNTGGYEAFEKAVDRGIAAGLGMDYPTFASNLEGVNYSSFRGGLIEVYRAIEGDQEDFVNDTCLPIVSAVMLEAFERGYLAEPNGWPDFESHHQAYLAGSWIGPGRGTIDPVKEAQGDKMEMEAGLNSASRIAARRGADIEEVYDELVMEIQMRKERGLPPGASLADFMGQPPQQRLHDDEE